MIQKLTTHLKARKESIVDLRSGWRHHYVLLEYIFSELYSATETSTHTHPYEHTRAR
jgi:hypothetical protein